MGAYKSDQISKDFDIVMKGINITIIDKYKILALEILQFIPDNQGRDLALANLLESADFIRVSIIEESAQITNRST